MAISSLYKVMRRNWAIILLILASALVIGCAQPAPPPETPKVGLFLTVIQPADNSIVSSDRVEVRGRTSPGAVVSVNGELVEVDEEGNFTITLTLEEGPSIIEVIASDEEGNEATTSLIVTLVKGG